MFTPSWRNRKHLAWIARQNARFRYNGRGFSAFTGGTAFALTDFRMRDKDEYIGGYDIGLAVLVVTAAWLLIFQSGLFGR